MQKIAKAQPLKRAKAILQGQVSISLRSQSEWDVPVAGRCQRDTRQSSYNCTDLSRLPPLQQWSGVEWGAADTAGQAPAPRH